MIEHGGNTLIDGAGRVLMPGMLDVRVHLTGNINTFAELDDGKTQSGGRLCDLCQSGARSCCHGLLKPSIHS
jgi:hypothetical protein